MKIKMPITRKKIKNHFTYAWWQYAVLICVAVLGWNIIYTTTRYRSPDNLKVELYGESYLSLDQGKNMETLMDELHHTVFADMEEVTFTPVGQDETYGDMQLLVWASAGEGDVYMLEKARFNSLGQNGAMLDLAPYIEDGTLNVEGIDLKNGYVTDTETGKKYLMGIPTDELTGLHEYGAYAEGLVMGVLVGSGNDECAIKLISWLLDEMR
ncbi:MAG: hypothetical protein GX096_02705 [Clostridiales bacterium]|nr:hypothetical protein [Clostridiales bacterium]